MSKYKVRKGDEVVVLIGRSRGMTGKIESISTKSDRVYVAGVNLYKKHQKPGQAQSEGGIIDKPMPLPISNVALLDPKKKKATKIGFKVDSNAGKVRIAKVSGSTI